MNKSRLNSTYWPITLNLMVIYQVYFGISRSIVKSKEMCTGEIHTPVYYGYEHRGQCTLINISIRNWNCLLPTLMSTKDQQMSWNLALFVLDNRLPFKHIIHVWNHSWYNVFTVSELRTMKLKLQIDCILRLEILHHYA